MSKSSFITGLILSLVFHGVFLLPAKSRQAAVIDQIKPQMNKVVKLTLPASPLIEKAPKTPPKTEPPKEPPGPDREPLQQVVEAPKTTMTNELGDLSDSESDDGLPELRLIWESPEQLLHVAKHMGMRILMVNRNNQPVQEVDFSEGIAVRKFKGRLKSFSNRVRRVSAQFLGPDILQQASEPIQCFWVLVPYSVDQAWLSIQRGAMRSQGLKASQIAHMEARITSTGSAHELAVTKVVGL